MLVTVVVLGGVVVNVLALGPEVRGPSMMDF
jgi:hypothetical protein